MNNITVTDVLLFATGGIEDPSIKTSISLAICVNKALKDAFDDLCEAGLASDAIVAEFKLFSAWAEPDESDEGTDDGTIPLYKTRKDKAIHVSEAIVGDVGEFRVAASGVPRTGESPSTKTSISDDGQLLKFRLPLSKLEGFDPNVHCIKVQIEWSIEHFVTAKIEDDLIVGTLRFSDLSITSETGFGSNWNYAFELADRRNLR